MSLIPAAQAAAETAAPPNSGLFQIGMIVFFVVVYYLMLVRPQQKRQKEHQKMLDALELGDEVATNAGILGKVRKLEDNYVVLKVDDSVELKFQRGAIAAVLPKGTIKSIQ